VKIVWILSLAVFAVAAAVQLGVGGVLPLVSIAVSFRVLTAIVGATVVGSFFALALVRRRFRIRLSVAFGLAVVLAAAGLAMTPPARDAPPPPTTAVRVLEWNVVQGGVGAAAMPNLIERTHPDIVVFAELYADNLPRLEGWSTPAGYQTLGPRETAVTVLVSKKLGTYSMNELDESGATSGFVAVPSVPGSPRIVAAHLSRQSITGDQRGWRAGLDWISTQCAQPNAIVVGDLNTTARNVGTLGGCSFSAQSSAPSWPTWLPSSLGASIDNVLTTRDWRVDTLQTMGNLDGSGSDHRPMFATVSPTSSA
jgi:endonuclease/exonuclease/phosphatase (EEP) superfamily protein YafD